MKQTLGLVKEKIPGTGKNPLKTSYCLIFLPFQV
jgi:hypothetical protein